MAVTITPKPIVVYWSESSAEYSENFIPPYGKVYIKQGYDPAIVPLRYEYYYYNGNREILVERIDSIGSYRVVAYTTNTNYLLLGNELSYTVYKTSINAPVISSFACSYVKLSNSELSRADGIEDCSFALSESNFSKAVKRPSFPICIKSSRLYFINNL